ncbi:MAG: cell filamentation protein Fic, partial [Flavobacteriales bacterium]
MENAIEIYQSKDGLTSIEVKFENETIWLTQSQMEELFEKEKRTISEHINNIFKEGELERNSTVRNFR